MAPPMVNYLAIFIAALAAFGLGIVWHTVMFKPWIRASGKSAAEVERKGYTVPFAITFVALIVMAWMLAGLLSHLGQVNVRGGLIAGALVWLGFVLTTMGTNDAFAGVKPLITLIDTAYWLAALLVIGAVLGAFGI
jgi:hypothetical protein